MECFVAGTKERYEFLKWPKESRCGVTTKNVLINKDAFKGFTLVSRDSTGQPYSYEDLYVCDENRDIRVKITVTNAASFDKAKDNLIQRLATFTNPLVDKWNPDYLPIDVGYATGDSKLVTANFIIGNTLVDIANVGLDKINLTEFIKAIESQF